MSAASSSRPSSTRLVLVLVVVVAVVVAVVWSVANERPSSTVAASVGEAELTLAELTESLRSNPDIIEAGDGVVLSTSDTSSVLSTFLIVEAVAQELELEGYEITDAIEAEALAGVLDPRIDPDDQYGTQVVRLGAVNLVLEAYASDVAAEQAADREPPEYLCASHVLVATIEEALDVLDALEGGADFAAVATERSIDPSAQTNGGDLGCSPTAGYVPEFSDGARENGPGLTPPVQSQFGFHIIDVRSIGLLTAENHPELDADEVQGLLDNDAAQRAQQVVAEIAGGVVQRGYDRVAADGYVDPRYGVWDGLNGQIEPPDGIAAPAPLALGG